MSYFVIKTDGKPQVKAPKSTPLQCVDDGALLHPSSVIISSDRSLNFYAPQNFSIINNGEQILFKNGDQFSLDVSYYGIRLYGEFVYNGKWEPLHQGSELAIQYMGLPISCNRVVFNWSPQGPTISTIWS